MTKQTKYQTNCQLVLASTSFIRHQMMKEVGLDVLVQPPNVDEQSIKLANQALGIAELTTLLSDTKGELVSLQEKDSYVISADQIGLFEQSRLDKSLTLADCENQLSKLQGKKHELYTATSLFKNGQCLWHTVQKVSLTMKKLSTSQIKQYVAIDKPLSSVGGYYFEKNGRVLFSDIMGSSETILGLERQRLLSFLKFKKIIV